MLTEKQVPPDLHVRHWGWGRRGRAQLNGRDAGLTERHDRQIALFDVVTVGARPLVHCRVRTGVCNLGLQRGLRLHGLRGLRLHEFVLLVQQFEFLEAAVELEHDEHQRDDPDDHNHAAQIERKSRHASILIVL